MTASISAGSVFGISSLWPWAVVLSDAEFLQPQPRLLPYHTHLLGVTIVIGDSEFFLHHAFLQKGHASPVPTG